MKKRSQSKVFGIVPGGYVDRSQEWNRRPLPSLNIPPGRFEAWIAATDLPPYPGGRGASACAWEILRCGEAAPIISEVRPGRPIESDEQKAYVAGVLGVLERLPAKSMVTIYCRAQWVVDAINGDLDKWKSQGRLGGKNAVAYAAIWKRILARRSQINSDVSAVSAQLLRSDDTKGQQIIDRLTVEARRVRAKLGSRD